MDVAPTLCPSPTTAIVVADPVLSRSYYIRLSEGVVVLQ